MASPGHRDAPELPDFGLLKRLARDQLVYLLEQVGAAGPRGRRGASRLFLVALTAPALLLFLPPQLPGKKDLFIEADLMSPLDRIANVSILKQHEVDKLYKVENKPAHSNSDQLCFLVRPRIRNVKYVADIVNADKTAGRTRKYKIIFSPQKFYTCEMVLEDEGIYGDVTWDEWNFYLLPLDDDILSMELPEFFRDYFLVSMKLHDAASLTTQLSSLNDNCGAWMNQSHLVVVARTQEGDQRWISTVAQALQLLSSLFGPFTRTYGIGRCAKSSGKGEQTGVLSSQMAHELWRDIMEESEVENMVRKPEIGSIFLMDRDVDYVTALCSQVVYEGLVDDTFRIKCGSVDFGPEVTSSDRSIKVLLNAQDKVFNQIRNEHFSSVFGFLSQKARNLQAQYDRRRGMDIKQMKDFVSQELKGLKQEHRLLSLHIGACESIMKKKTRQDFQELLKTEHALLEGFNIRESISFIEEHIDRQVSPIESLRMLCLLSMTENGLPPKDYRSLKTQYLQIPRVDGEYDLKVPRDMAYVFSGAYIPLSCKIIEQVLERKSWLGLEEAVRLLGGNEFTVTTGEQSPAWDSQRVILAVFLGGCTFSEISALRFLGRERGLRFVFLTTAVTNSVRLLESMMEAKAEALANESVACLNRALGHLRDIWEEIGIPEDQRLQRTDVVRKHVKGLLDMMIAEEERLKERLLQSIALCRKELATLCRELQAAPFEEDEEATILQLEKDLRTRVEVLLKQKRERKQELKALQERDQDLCDLLCAAPFPLDDAEAVPSLAQLDGFRRHLAALTAEKVGVCPGWLGGR
ncbi:hypothetical protein JD844_014776 [Phrynosoma platyrhinos]|uniref:Vacuolar protein sorting-associated protein 33B n=1 Tax=Phrynosoma platyrhinos TaxID=52577 RepID=A0ABQ7SS46_PHRPL|nr:hypothetical protein JD844_014776 [Phrynosoma platyrhinos]